MIGATLRHGARLQGVFKLENAGLVGLRTFALYAFTAICAAMQGVTFFLIFKPWMYQLQVRLWKRTKSGLYRRMICVDFCNDHV